MSISLTPPAVEPLSLPDAKAFLRVEHGDDDDLIGALVASARIHVETLTRRALIAQTSRFARDRWPASGIISVRPAPLRELVAVRVYRADNTAQLIATDGFGVDRTSSILLVPEGMPAPARPAAGIEIDVEVGYGEEPSDVPEPLRQAIRLLVAYWYENRSLPTGHDTAVPGNVSALLAPYRAVSL
jgi:uncharacterized phiE125 gp8 family phage protein